MRLFLACTLLGIYLLVYANAPADADGQALLSVAETAVLHGRLDMNVIGYTEWFLTDSGKMGNFGSDGALYAKKGITPSLLMIPLVVAAKLAPWLSIRATAMLLNPLVTTATALLLFELVRRLGYRDRTALALGLIYGLATFALTYVKTLFGEPLAALLVLGIVFLAVEKGDRPYRLAAIGALLGLLIGLNTIYALLVPIVGLLVLVGRPVRSWVAFALPIGAALGLLALYNWARFGSPFTSGYQFAAGEGFNNPFFLGVFGLTFSPYRGVFWYNPILLLAIPGWLMFRRIHNHLAWLALALIALQIVAFASWWSWHGGVTWGARFLLPVLPLAVLFLAPLIESGKRWLLTCVGGFALLSLGIQILGVLYNYLIYESYLFVTFWPDLNTAVETLRRSPVLIDPLLSPIIGHVALLRAGLPIEMAWLTANGVDGLYLLAALGLLGVGIVTTLLRRGAWILAGAAMLISLNVVAARQTATVAHEIEQVVNPPGMLVAATTLFDTKLMDIENGARVLTMNAPTAPDDERARRMWDYALKQDQILWLLTWFGKGQAENWQERELWQSAYFVAERPYANHRALWFDLTPPLEPAETGEWNFDQTIQLDSYAVSADPDGVRVVMTWRLLRDIEANASWFIHLLDANGQIVAQQDRPPQGGYASQQADASITDRMFFPLNADVTGWQLRVGWVDPTAGLLPAFDAQNQPLPDDFVLIPFTP